MGKIFNLKELKDIETQEITTEKTRRGGGMDGWREE